MLLSVEEVQMFLSLIAEERIQRELDGAKPKEKALCYNVTFELAIFTEYVFCLFLPLYLCFASIKNNLIE